jgi:hypothetical protein
MNGGTSANAFAVYELQAKEFTGYWSGQQTLDQARMKKPTSSVGRINGNSMNRKIWNADAPSIEAALRFIDGFRVFDNVYTLTGSGPGGSTASLPIYIYESFFKQGAIRLGNRDKAAAR